MAKQIYKKEKQRPAFQKKEKEQASVYTLKSIFQMYDIRNYYGDLDNEIIARYKKICEECGFDFHLYKNRKELEKEYEVYIQNKSKSLLNKKNKLKKIKLPEFISLVEDNQISPENHLSYNFLYEVYKNALNKEDVMFFFNVIKNLKINIKNKDDENLIALNNIFKYKAKWISDINNFVLKTKNLKKAITQLSEYLFIKYEINNIYKELIFDNKKFVVFVKISQGESPKKVIDEYLPEFNLTKKMIHKLNTEKTNLTFNKRIRELQLTGFQNKIIQEVLKSFKANNFVEDESLFMDYLIYLNNQDLSLLESDQIMPIFDYVKHFKRVCEQREVDFKLKNYSLPRLYEDMIQWHRELGKTKHDYTWEGLNLPVYHSVKYKNDNEFITKEVKIEELTSSNELRKEGRQMNHCVASYARSCKNGVCSIFSLKVKEFNASNLKSKATIEVRNKQTVQIRAKHNLKVSDSDMNYINIWKKENGIR